MADDRRKRESFHRGRYRSIANQRATLRRSWPAVVVATLSTPSAPFFLHRPPSASRLIPPPRGQMGVPAYVKAALCSAHPRSAICQCQGASAVSMETPPASRQRRKRASEHERVNEPSGAVGDPPVLRHYHPAGTTQPPGFHHHRRSTARLPPFRPSSDTHPRGRSCATAHAYGESRHGSSFRHPRRWGRLRTRSFCASCVAEALVFSLVDEIGKAINWQSFFGFLLIN